LIRFHRTIPDLAALSLVLLAILTLPHVVIVTWLDTEQGLLGSG